MSHVFLLDGGMGQELIARSAQPPSPLWSAQVLLEEPEIVEAVHRDYVTAGAMVVTLNTYSATPERLARDASEELFKPLQAKAITVAKAAIAGSDARLGGCLPPLYASYHPELAPNYETCLAAYRRIVAEQADAVDLFILETLSALQEIRAAVVAAKETGKPVLCGMSVMDDDGTLLRSGDPLAEGVRLAKEAGADAVGINCSWPEAVTQGLPVLAASGLPFGGWANAFTKADELKAGGTVQDLKKRSDLGPDAYADHAMAWVEAGATIVGGCCETGPAHIERLAAHLTDGGHTLKAVL